MDNRLAKPVYRSAIRKFLGRQYFILKRKLKWWFGKRTFAIERATTPLPHRIFQHQTPLIRELKNADRWMQENKIVNLRIATQKLQGLLLKPGETFSYWYLIGPTTRRRGYKTGMILDMGRVKPGVGGGLCQLSNLIYWMTLHSPLTVTERWRHSFDVFPDAKRTQPFGSGATCAYNYIDLQIRNNTPHTFQLQLEVGDTHLHGAWHTDVALTRRYEIYESKHEIHPTYWGAYSRHNEIRRKIFDLASGELVEDEYVTENHALMMYAPFLEPASD